MNHGWQCPICNYVYSPSTPGCYNCNRPESEKYVTSTEILIGGAPVQGLGSIFNPENHVSCACPLCVPDKYKKGQT